MTDDDPDLMTAAEVAAFFRVHPKTVNNWARASGARPALLPAIKTPGGTHNRFRRADVEALREKMKESGYD